MAREELRSQESNKDSSNSGLYAGAGLLLTGGVAALGYALRRGGKGGKAVVNEINHPVPVNQSRNFNNDEVIQPRRIEVVDPTPQKPYWDDVEPEKPLHRDRLIIDADPVEDYVQQKVKEKPAPPPLIEQITRAAAPEPIAPVAPTPPPVVDIPDPKADFIAKKKAENAARIEAAKPTIVPIRPNPYQYKEPIGPNVAAYGTGGKGARWKQEVRNNPDIAMGFNVSGKRLRVSGDGQPVQSAHNTDERIKHIANNAYHKPHQPRYANPPKDLNELKKRLRTTQSTRGAMSAAERNEFIQEELDLISKTGLNPDDWVYINHGGDRARIEGFINRGNGSYRVDNPVVGDNGRVGNRGIMVHQRQQHRTAAYGHRLGDDIEPMAFTGKIQRKYLQHNQADEFSIHKDHWNKIHDVRTFTPADKEWTTGDFYGSTKPIVARPLTDPNANFVDNSIGPGR